MRRSTALAKAVEAAILAINPLSKNDLGGGTAAEAVAKAHDSLNDALTAYKTRKDAPKGKKAKSGADATA